MKNYFSKDELFKRVEVKTRLQVGKKTRKTNFEESGDVL